METTAASHTLEITVLSCEDLRIYGRSLKKNAFVVVQTHPFNYRATRVDAEGGSCPSWDEELVLNMPAVREPFVTLGVYCKKASGYGNDTVFGTARVPATDFMGGYLPEDYLRFLSYRLVDTRGKRNGIINVSVRVRSSAPGFSSKKKMGENVPAEGSCCSSSMSSGAEAAATAAVGYEKSAVVDGIVTGIPVWGAGAVASSRVDQGKAKHFMP